MKIILLSGGIGKRLWPISTEEMPKQFLSFGHNETMLMNTYKKIIGITNSIYVATQKSQIDMVKEQLGDSISIISEASIRGTFGAIMNIAKYLKYKENISDDEIIVTIPIDHLVNEDFYEVINKIPNYLSNNIDFCIIGIKPKYASTQFGYIVEKNNMVEKFIEKPNERKANELISNGAYWNSGILAFKLDTINKISEKYLPTIDYADFYNNYDKLPEISFDKEILEKSKKVYVIKSNSQWDDLGTWNHLYNMLSEADDFNTNIINTENKIIVNNGIKDSIIVNDSNGIALYPKNYDKEFYKTWGFYKVLSHFKIGNEKIKIKYLKFNNNENTSYQCHTYRDEIWNIISGTGIAILDGKLIKLKSGDSLTIKKMQKHLLRGINDLEIIEIQKGLKTMESDIVRYKKNWNEIIDNYQSYQSNLTSH